MSKFTVKLHKHLDINNIILSQTCYFNFPYKLQSALSWALDY